MANELIDEESVGKRLCMVEGGSGGRMVVERRVRKEQRRRRMDK